ncbi:MAG TPA: glycosyltransferase family 9 protein [Acidobacteriaceae bacterium]|jgi:heptosyltransferase-3|nr:glycosyltransferase family 9 protein [Acidobacteriaceae bacterium]
MGKRTTRRVLVYRLGSLGDMVVSLPALHLVARAFPEAERRMLTNVPVSSKAPAAAAILEGSGLVQGYMRYEVGTRSVRELLGVWWQIARWRPQVLVYLAAPRGVKAAQRDEAFFRLCGVRRIVGVPLTEGMQRNYYGAATGGKDHAMGAGHLEPEAGRLARCIGQLAGVGDIADPGRLNDPASWDLHLSAEERESAARAIGAEALGVESIAVSVGTKVQAKDWGRDNWRALLGRLAAEFPGRALLLLGAAEESEASEFAAKGWRANDGGVVVNLCGALTPRESAAAIARARLFVGHDSGPMHLAAAVGTPVVAIFAARNIPRQWFPFGKQHRVVYHRVECWGCGLETCIEQQKKCLMSITVDEVMEVVRSQLLVLSKGATEN